MKAEEFLNKALKTLSERGKRYDKDGERKMAKVVSIYNTLFTREDEDDMEIGDAYKLMISLKLSRMFDSNFFEDDYIDLINYIALLGESQTIYKE